MIKLRNAVLFGTLFFVNSGVSYAGYPSVDACGDAGVNREDGVRDKDVISKELETQIERFLQRADATPAASISVVKDGKIVYARGFGFRDLDTCEKADAATRYYLKSTTKSFTGMMAAILHEEGTIDLDAAISEYLPGLKLPAPLNPEQISLRSHFTHTQPYFDAGLNYRTAFPGNLPESAFVAHINTFSQATDIKFRYSNFGPIVGAHAIGRHVRSNWRDLIREKIFKPAGMRDSFTSITEAAKGPLATSYTGAERDDYIKTPTKTDNQMHAAGGAVSTVSDLGRWIILNLDKGAIDGKQALPRRAIEQAQARQVQLKATFGEYERFAHGLGLYSADYDGDLLMHHFGGETHVSFMPEHGIGIAILSNEIGFGGYLTHDLASTIYDALLGREDLKARTESRLTKIAAAKANRVKRYDDYVKSLTDSAPQGENTFPAAALIGHYSDARLGGMAVSKEGPVLTVTFGELEGPMIRTGADAYLAHIGAWGAPPELFILRNDKELGLVIDWGGRIFQRD